MIPDVSYGWIFSRKHADEMGNWRFKTGRRFHLSKRGIILEASLSYCTIEKTSLEPYKYYIPLISSMLKTSLDSYKYYIPLISSSLICFSACDSLSSSWMNTKRVIIVKWMGVHSDRLQLLLLLKAMQSDSYADKIPFIYLPLFPSDSTEFTASLTPMSLAI